MASKRCTICAIEYPTGLSECPVCDEKLWLDPAGTPHDTWQWEAQALIIRRDKDREFETQPYFLLLPVLQDDDGRDYIVRYAAYQARHGMILQPGDVIELPADDAPGETYLWEVQYNDRNFGRYYIRAMRGLPGPTKEVTLQRPGSPSQLTGTLTMYDPDIWEPRDGD